MLEQSSVFDSMFEVHRSISFDLQSPSGLNSDFIQFEAKILLIIPCYYSDFC